MKLVSDAYGHRSVEYTTLLGSVDTMEPLDILLIKHWGSRISGDILDAGCGPGHWSQELANEGNKVFGIDITAEFITDAKRKYPLIDFKMMDMTHTSFGDEKLDGILAWYSLIHLPPEYHEFVFAEFERILAPGGSLLIGFFLGHHGQKFPHAVTDAFFVSQEKIRTKLHSAGFEVEEFHTRVTGRHRDHAAVIARKKPSMRAEAVPEI